jgi:hypothetical protein
VEAFLDHHVRIGGVLELDVVAEQLQIDARRCRSYGEPALKVASAIDCVNRATLSPSVTGFPAQGLRRKWSGTT